jgi:hypothetical protein
MYLPRLAEALSVSTDELLRTPEAPDPRVRGSSHTHNDVTFWPLTRQGSAGGLHAFKIRISAKRRKPPAELPVHEGQDWMYVLSGRIDSSSASVTSSSNQAKPSNSAPGHRTGSEPPMDLQRPS